MVVAVGAGAAIGSSGGCVVGLEDSDDLDHRKASSGCHSSCYCLGISCPPAFGDCSGCGKGPGIGNDDGDTCDPSQEICSVPGDGGDDDGGSGDGGGPPSCWGAPLLELQCIDDPENPYEDGCVCGKTASWVEEAHHFWCEGFFDIMPSPPSTNPCTHICAPLESDPIHHQLCTMACNEICIDDICPEDLDIWGQVVDAVCCDLATGTDVPAMGCAGDHPLPEDPSIACCNNWLSSCQDCCADFGGSAQSVCLNQCLDTILHAELDGDC
ncbi:MAG: hypothetical protein K0V04_36940 [Deltaproteobacteria bacterium]|nr:hypothetical protein [Deltaproteobacteria bacterium]